MKYEVLFLDVSGCQLSGGIYYSFVDATAHRNDLIAQGYEAWIEEVFPNV